MQIHGKHIAWLGVAALLLSGCGDDATADDDTGHDTEHDAGSELDASAGDLEPEMVPCDDDIEAVTIGLQTIGRDGLYMAEIADVSPGPPQKYRNDWQVRILDASGDPLPSANITKAQAFMPAHGHDGIYDPEVSATEEDAQYEVNNLYLWMGGPWEVRLWVDGEAGEDYLVFDVCIED